ncbi:MAG: MBL fold metallo-hydrolase [Woeseiaceae bacterium]|nr:MBL fold metallo-hydrolase [Woeseiaceae bacterium]
MHRGFFVVLLLSLSASANAQFDIATELKTTEVEPGIYMIEGADGFSGGTVGLLVGEERIVLIDDFVEPLSGTLLKTAGKVAGRPVDFVINTHVHGDHIGGNATLAHHGATVVAHDNIRERMLADEKTDPDGLPILTFSDSVTFHLNGMTAHVLHVAEAHTDGDAIIHFPEQNVIHAGDILFNHIFPFIDLDNGGTVDGFIAAQKKLVEMADDNTKIIAGHGPLGSRSDLERNLQVLVDSQSKVKALVDKGMSADEVVAANPLAEFHEGWNWAFITTERMTRTLYRDLTE